MRSSAAAAWCRSTIFTSGKRQRRASSLTPLPSPIAASWPSRGVWENWKSPAGEWVRSFAIITTEPNELCAELHNRMPVVLAPETWPSWLGEGAADQAQLKSLLVPYPSDGMFACPVSPLVGSVRNNDPSLIEPIVLP